jgi:predicted ribosome quality control (RQC) complex YloA/Tae2 family protein
MTKSNSTAFIKENHDKTKKDFNAPFYVVLQKKFTNAKIQKIYLLNDDKVLNIEVLAKSSYKVEHIILQLEFTGKNTNIIVLDDKRTILEALRHIDEYSSSRVVKVGLKLDDLKKPDFVFEQKDCTDIVEVLKDVYIKNEMALLNSIKTQKINQISKQSKKIKDILNKLEDTKALEEKANTLYKQANILLSNLHNIKAYDQYADLVDFEGNDIRIKLDLKYPNPSVFANQTFKNAKKLKQKVLNQYLEEENLSQKLMFYERLYRTIQEAKSIDEIEYYIPKKDKKQTKTKKAQPYQSFFIDGYKILLGRDERENIYLLQNSKASDFWFHLQGQVSSHVIVSNSKKNIPEHIIEEAAKICAQFSSDEKGTFVVDFTQRRNVKIQTRANVLYNPYSTLVVKV